MFDQCGNNNNYFYYESDNTGYDNKNVHLKTEIF